MQIIIQLRILRLVIRFFLTKWQNYLHLEAEKRNRFSFMNKFVNMQWNLTKLVLLLLMNVIVNVTNCISGMYINFRTFYAKSVRWDITSLATVLI